MRKTRIKYYKISHGYIIAAWQILFLVSRYSDITPQSIVKILSNSGKMGGSVPAKKALKICLDYELLLKENEL